MTVLSLADTLVRPDRAPRAVTRYCPSCEQSFDGLVCCPDDGTRLVALNQRDRFVGTSLDNRYAIVERLGVGGMGTVYRARQLSMDRDVAIKIVKPSLSNDATVMKRFLREARLTSRLAHPGAITLLDFGQTATGLPYLVMELLTGPTLEHVLLERGKLAPAHAIDIAIQICDVLDTAHTLRIVHRDLKPANIALMAGPNGRDLVKVLDFGIAKSLAPDPDSADATTTQAGVLVGTPGFVAPETLRYGVADERADLYALGCVLYAMLSGNPPFTAQSLHALMVKHVYDLPPPPEGASSELVAIVQRLLAKDPADRFTSALELQRALIAAARTVERDDVEDIEIVIDEPPPAPAAPTLVDRPRRRCRPLVLVAQLFGMLALAATVTIATAARGATVPIAPPPATLVPAEALTTAIDPHVVAISADDAGVVTPRHVPRAATPPKTIPTPLDTLPF